VTLLLLAVRLYLELFALGSLDPAHARRENRLVLGGIAYLREGYLAGGATGYRAGVLALRDHLGELQPVALLQKVRADEWRTRRPRTAAASLQLLASAFVQVLALAAGVLLIVLIVMLVVAPVTRRGR
jgi:hypothetical protein